MPLRTLNALATVSGLGLALFALAMGWFERECARFSDEWHA